MKITYKEPEPQKKLDDWAYFEAEEPFNWRAYNNSQTREKIIFLSLLKELCHLANVDTYAGSGRRPQEAGKMILCMCIKVYTSLGSRRLLPELELLKDKYLPMGTIPHFNTICNYFGLSCLTKWLKQLIELSALPLAQLEKKFAIDSTGFSERKYLEKWSSVRQKYSMHQQYRKAHCVCGTFTNIITSIIATKGNEADSPQFIELLKQTADNFNVEQVTADKAYSSRENLQYASDLNITPFIPFKNNARGLSKGAPAWNKMFRYFKDHPEDFYKNYHARSNVESTFFMIKQRFGDYLMFKDPVAQTNEILCKALCHNLCVLAQELYLSNIEINFKNCASTMIAHE